MYLFNHFIFQNNIADILSNVYCFISTVKVKQFGWMKTSDLVKRTDVRHSIIRRCAPAEILKSVYWKFTDSQRNNWTNQRTAEQRTTSKSLSQRCSFRRKVWVTTFFIYSWYARVIYIRHSAPQMKCSSSRRFLIFFIPTLYL